MAPKSRPAKRHEAAVAAKGYLTVLNADIYNAREALQKLMAKELPVRTSFALAKLGNTLNGHLQAIEVVRNGLVKKYGTPLEGKPGSIQVKPDTEEFAKFQAEMNELFGVEVEVAAQKIMLPADLNGMGIEAATLLPLLKFVDMEESKAT